MTSKPVISNDSLVLYIPFSEVGQGLKDTDYSGNGNDGTHFGSPERHKTTNGKWYIKFDGINDYSDIGNIVGNGIRTISMWFRPTNVFNGDETVIQSLIFRDAFDGKGEYGLLLMNATGKLRFSRRIGVDIYEINSDATSWNANQWYHVVGTIDTTDGMQMYIDGVKQVETNVTTDPTDTEPDITAIGRFGAVDVRYFDGSVSDVMMFTGALTAGEVKKIYQVTYRK